MPDPPWSAGRQPARAAQAEPETRTLSPGEARRVLERDWLYQAGHSPSASRIQQEIEWARELAARIARHEDAPDLSREFAELTALEKRVAGGPAAAGVRSLAQRSQRSLP